jgi:hypothetical protein
MLLLKKAHRAAKLFCGTSDLNSYCLEACVVMVEYLHRHGHHAQLIRRECQGDGHWTIHVDKAEYDPTCADWPNPPADSHPGTLYRVTNESPHHGWPRTRVNKQAAYATAGITHRTFQTKTVARNSNENPAGPDSKS